MKKIIILSVFAFALLISANSNTYSNPTSLNSDSALVCIVSGETIEGEGVKYVYLNKVLVFCCEGCKKSFKKKPAKFLGSAGLMCPVCNEVDAKEDLSSVTNGVKYYFCGKGCKDKFRKDPDEFLNKYNK